MIGNVVLPGTKPDQWPGIRGELEKRILATFGTPSLPVETEKPGFQELKRYENYGLTHILLKYRVIGDEWNEAVVVLPGKTAPKKPIPAVLAIHGSNEKEGKANMLIKQEGPEHAYAVELAEHGYVAMAPDQFGFGVTIASVPQKELYVAFYKKHPDWTLDGRRLLEQKAALGVLAQLEYVDKTKLGVIGHSLGGRAVTHLACLDERLAACVSSTGLSPNCTNIYRRIGWSEPQNPIIGKHIRDTFGRVPWDYHEMLALCAPRPYLALEPFNDDYNPDVMVTLECVKSAADVYTLIGKPENLSLLLHGQGHDAATGVRAYAYRWFDRFLLGKETL